MPLIILQQGNFSGILDNEYVWNTTPGPAASPGCLSCLSWSSGEDRSSWIEKRKLRKQSITWFYIYTVMFEEYSAFSLACRPSPSYSLGDFLSLQFAGVSCGGGHLSQRLHLDCRKSEGGKGCQEINDCHLDPSSHQSSPLTLCEERWQWHVTEIHTFQPKQRVPGIDSSCRSSHRNAWCTCQRWAGK